MASEPIHHGACLCGAIRYTVTGGLSPVVACHCTMCRRQTGHFFASTNVDEDDLALDGVGHVRWFAASDVAERGFCGNCGSVLFWRRPGSSRIAIAMGGFDKPTGTMVDRHIFVADKGDYYEIADGIQQFPGDD
ncbi:Uncharacterized conserved protein [Kaistia soli DSM 19436]|uniref:Uncharacterized conserved protein n=1 Tax=Kaistia soli DSM 19436 TaxID=1122133 RepID=A0A1M5K2W9_9HYPH|nr:GFA family protein [Kaistia soli]SHG46920.1 Uncharacterized conserved protein [Kaistia soli DSM 19436]